MTTIRDRIGLDGKISLHRVSASDLAFGVRAQSRRKTGIVVPVAHVVPVDRARPPDRDRLGFGVDDVADEPAAIRCPASSTTAAIEGQRVGDRAGSPRGG